MARCRGGGGGGGMWSAVARQRRAQSGGTAQHETGEGWGWKHRHVGPIATMLGFKLVQTEAINSNTLKFISNNFKL
jgi:hypothetical protein